MLPANSILNRTVNLTISYDTEFWKQVLSFFKVGNMGCDRTESCGAAERISGHDKGRVLSSKIACCCLKWGNRRILECLILNTTLWDLSTICLRRSIKSIPEEAIGISVKLTLKILHLQSCAIVGPSGSGKSTLLRILVRMYDVTNGAVELEGINVTDLKQSSLRGAVAVVPQETVLFNESWDLPLTCF